MEERELVYEYMIDSEESVFAGEKISFEEWKDKHFNKPEVKSKKTLEYPETSVLESTMEEYYKEFGVMAKQIIEKHSQ